MFKLPIGMKELRKRDLLASMKERKYVMIGRAKIALDEFKKITHYQPSNFKLERTNVWSFPERGNWATHKGDFRGNWAPQVPRNLILRYSKFGETVLDQMCGSGTTLVECKLLGRKGIGIDVNPECIILTLSRLQFRYSSNQAKLPRIKQSTFIGDARNLDLLENDTVDLIATHPPYANVISYSTRTRQVSGDLSFAHTLDRYIQGIKEIAEESFRVLKPKRYCAILVGDTRKRRHHIPIAFKVLQEFLKAGFILREDVIKHQWKTKGTREKWQGLSKVADENWVKEHEQKNFTDFLLLSHEHLFIFRKPSPDEDLKLYKGSLMLD